MPNLRPQTRLKRLRPRVNGRVKSGVVTRDKPRSAPTRITKPSVSSDEESSNEESESKKEPICTICYEDLSLKRESTIACCHKFHHTCIIKWMETRENAADQLCPNCRNPYKYVRCGRITTRDLEAYGKSQQPTWWLINQKAKELEGGQIDRTRSNLSPQNHNFILNLEDVRENALAQATNRISSLHEEREKAVKKNKSQEYMDDIDEEIMLYKNRENVIREIRKMMKAAKDAGILPPEPTYKSDWNLESEMYHVYRAMPGTMTTEGRATELIQGLPNIEGLNGVRASIIRPPTTSTVVDEDGVERQVRFRVERISVTEDVDIEELRRMGFQVVPADYDSDEEITIETLGGDGGYDEEEGVHYMDDDDDEEMVQ